MPLRYIGRTSETRDLLLVLRSAINSVTAQAKQEKVRLRGDLASRICKLKRLARKRGFQQGINAALQVVATMQREFEELQKELERVSVDISVAIAREVIFDSVIVDPNIVKARVAKLFEEVSAAHALRLEACPEEIKAVAELLRELRLQIPVTGSRSLSRGDATLFTASGIISLDWRQHLSRLNDALGGRNG